MEERRMVIGAFSIAWPSAMTTKDLADFRKMCAFKIVYTPPGVGSRIVVRIVAGVAAGDG